MMETTISRLKTDFAEAETFLDVLAPEGAFTFQTFADDPNASPEEKRAVTRQFHGSLEDHFDELARLNDQGAGVFVTVNETDGLGRKEDNITAVRALFVDLDGAPLEPVESFEMPPSLIVNTSEGKWHAYWLIDGFDKSEFKKIQKSIAAQFGGDKAVNDLPRVMRLPGFYHQKGEPQQTKLIHVDADRRYTSDQMVKVFGQSDTKTNTEPSQLNETPVGDSEAAQNLTYQAARKSHQEPETSRHSIALALGYDCRRENLSREEAEIVAIEFAEHVRDTNPSGELAPFDRQEAIDAVLNAYTDGKDVSTSNALLPAVKTISDLLQLEFPPRETIVHPFILGHSLNMIVAKRGVGKTWFGLALAADIARGRKFLAWKVPQARRVLYVDGEMPLADLKTRLSAILHGEEPETLEILPSETLYLEGQPLTINTPVHQDRFEQLLDDLDAQGRAPEVVIFDNLSSLTSGMDENSNSDLDDFLHWLLKLRHRGLAVILVHHAGKNGDQRGASRREDLLDTVIKLVEPKSDDFTLRQGACFEVSFTKTRGMRPQPDMIEVKLVTDENGNLSWQIGDTRNIPVRLKVLKNIRDEKPQTPQELAKRRDVKVEAIYKQFRELRKEGLLEQGKLELTAKGLTTVDRLFDNF